MSRQDTNLTFSPYIAFCRAKREEVKIANPTANFGDAARILSAIWKDMSESEKAAYTKVFHHVDTRRSPTNEPGVRRSARLRNKQLGLDFWGLKINNKK
jgi:hypothetical protein